MFTKEELTMMKEALCSVNVPGKVALRVGQLILKLEQAIEPQDSKENNV